MQKVWQNDNEGRTYTMRDKRIEVQKESMILTTEERPSLRYGRERSNYSDIPVHHRVIWGLGAMALVVYIMVASVIQEFKS